MASTKSSFLTGRRPEAATSSTVRDGGGIVVQLRGEYDCATVPVLAEILAAAMALDGPDVVIDLSGVGFMGASTVRQLAQARDLLERQSRTFAVRAPSPCAQRVLDLCRATGLIEPATVDARGDPSSGSAALHTLVAVPVSDRVVRCVGVTSAGTDDVPTPVSQSA